MVRSRDDHINSHEPVSSRPGDQSHGRDSAVASQLLTLQRLAGNRAVGAMLAARSLQRRFDWDDPSADADDAPGHLPGAGHIGTDTRSLHAAIYGDSSLAHGSGPTPPPKYLVNYLTLAAFPWEAAPQSGHSLVTQWLEFYYFHEVRPTWTIEDPARCQFNGDAWMTTPKVADLFMTDAALSGRTMKRDFVLGDINMALSALRTATRAKEDADPNHGLGGGPDPGAKNGPADTPAKKADDNSTQVSLGFQFNLTKHKDLNTGINSTDPTTMQLSGTVTIPVHKDGNAGFEFSVQGAVSFFLKTGSGSPIISGLSATDVKVSQISNAQVAGQAAWVQPFFENTLQLSAFGQLVGGINWDPVAAGGSQAGGKNDALVLKRDPMAQVVGGVQAVYTWPGTNKHLQMFVQAQGSLSTSGQGQTGDRQASIGFQWAF